MGKITGKAATVTIATNTLPFTKITPSTDRKMANTTDNTNYDSGSDLIWPTQLPVMAPVIFTVEGWYDTTLLPTAFISTLWTGLLAQACVITRKSGSIYGHGNFDISNYDEGIQIDDTVSYTLKMMSNGIFTPNA